MKRLTTISFATTFVVGTDTFVIAPLLPSLSSRFGSPLSVSGWMVSAYAIGYCMTGVFAGPLSDRFDRRRVLILGMTLFAAATFACGLAWSFPAMIGFRFLAGVTAAIGTPQIWAAIPQLIAPEKVVAAMAAPTAGLTIAQLAGVPIGSFLATASPTIPFFVIGGAGALVTIAIALWFPHVPSHGAISSIAGQYTTLLRASNVPTRLSAYLVFQLGNFAVLSFAATWFFTAFGLDLIHVGTSMIVLGLANTLGTLSSAPLAAHWGRGRLLTAAMCVYLVAYLVLPWSPGIVVAAAVLSVTFFVGGTVFPVFMQSLQSLTTTARGTMSALTNVLMYAGSTVAGLIGGPLLANLPGFWGIAGLAFTCTAASLWLWIASGATRRSQ